MIQYPCFTPMGRDKEKPGRQVDVVPGTETASVKTSLCVMT